MVTRLLEQGNSPIETQCGMAHEWRSVVPKFGPQGLSDGTVYEQSSALVRIILHTRYRVQQITKGGCDTAREARGALIGRGACDEHVPHSPHARATRPPPPPCEHDAARVRS